MRTTVHTIFYSLDHLSVAPFFLALFSLVMVTFFEANFSLILLLNVIVQERMAEEYANFQMWNKS